MCAHIGQNRGIYRRVYSAYIFDSYPLPLLRRLTVGAAISENFFWFYFFVSPIWFLLVFYFFYFFIFSDFRLVYPILGFQLNRFQNVVSTRYNISLRIFSFALRFPTLIIILDSVFFDSIFRLVFTCLISTRINFDLFQHCRFYALTLRLFVSSACYKQTSMLMWVCFMLILAILRLSDVFSFVLGVVYRLWLK